MQYSIGNLEIKLLLWFTFSKIQTERERDIRFIINFKKNIALIVAFIISLDGLDV